MDRDKFIERSLSMTRAMFHETGEALPMAVMATRNNESAVCIRYSGRVSFDVISSAVSKMREASPMVAFSSGMRYTDTADLENGLPPSKGGRDRVMVVFYFWNEEIETVIADVVPYLEAGIGEWHRTDTHILFAPPAIWN